MPGIKQVGKSSACPHPFSLAGLRGRQGGVLRAADTGSPIRSGQLLWAAWLLPAPAGQEGSAGSQVGCCSPETPLLVWRGAEKPQERQASSHLQHALGTCNSASS